MFEYLMENKEMKINAVNEHRLQTYARSSRKTASAVLNEALEFWYEIQGEIVQDEMDKRNAPRTRKRPLAFPVMQANQ
jgi:hypothetical protein